MEDDEVMGATQDEPDHGPRAPHGPAAAAVPARRRGSEHALALLAEQLAPDALRLAAFVDALPAAVLVEDQDRRITVVNRRFRELFQLTATTAELVGMDAADVMARGAPVARDPDGFNRRLAQLTAARELVTDEEVPLADGRIVDLDYVPVVADGRWLGQLWMYWDVTERRVIERQRDRLLAAEFKARRATEEARHRLAEQNQRLQELDRLKTDFLATFAHELRTPLTSIVSFTDLLADAEPALPPRAAEFVAIIGRNAQRMLRLVADMLLLGQIEAGSLQLTLSAVSAAELVAEAAEARSAPAYRRGVTLEVSTQDGPPLWVDRLRILQVLDNLLSNAIKFTEPGGSVRIAARWEAGEWRLEVTDTGIGIPAAEIGRIFERFFRAEGARVGAVPGTGLGLTVVTAIVDLHGGRIAVHSAPGEGTTFTVYLGVSR